MCVAYKCSLLLGRNSLHGIHQRRGHGAVSVSSHGNEALVHRSRDPKECANVGERRMHGARLA